jgi:hypothetical protein
MREIEVEWALPENDASGRSGAVRSWSSRCILDTLGLVFVFVFGGPPVGGIVRGDDPSAIAGMIGEGEPFACPLRDLQLVMRWMKYALPARFQPSSPAYEVNSCLSAVSRLSRTRPLGRADQDAERAQGPSRESRRLRGAGHVKDFHAKLDERLLELNFD